MLRVWPNKQVPQDVLALLRVASETGATLRMDGELARALISLSEEGASQSLLDAIPPLSTLALEIFPAGDSEGLGRDVLAEVRRELPWTGFFSPRSAREPSPSSPKSFRIIDRPRVAIVPDLRALAAVRAAQPREALFIIVRDDKGTVLVDDELLTIPGLESSAVDSEDPAEMLCDLVHLAADASSYRDPLGIKAALIRRLTEAGPTLAAKMTPDLWSSLSFALLRFLIATGPGSSEQTMDQEVVDALDRLKANAPPQWFIRELVDQATNSSATPFFAVVIPDDVDDSTDRGRRGRADCQRAPARRRRISRFETGAEMQMPPEAPQHWQRIVQDCLKEGLNVSRPVEIEVCDPPNPWCCEYRDFSMGVAEVIWSSPPAPILKTRLPVVYLGRGDEVGFGSAYLSQTTAVSLRLDYGFLGYLRGTAGTVEVAAVWKDTRGGTEKEGADTASKGATP